METINTNGQIIGGAAEIVNLINDVRAKSFGERKYSINVKYGHYSILVANSDSCWVLRVYDENVQEVIPEDPNIWKFLWGKTQSKDITGRDYGFYLGRKWCGSLVERAAEEAIRIINEYEDDLELEEANTLNDYANELTAAVEENMTAIDDHIDSARELIKKTLNDGDPVDSEEISMNARRIKECLDLIKDAADYFIARASRLTGCDFCFEDFFNGDDLIFDFANAPVGFDLQDFCLDDVFEDILNYIFLAPSEDFDEYDAGSCTELLDLRDTLYHYLIAA